jgi:predicted enzyme related to lactoylglutathione lyase
LLSILREKLEIKPGDGGYIINTKSKDPKDIYIYQIDFESLDIDTVLSNVVINGGVIQANYKNLFAGGKG